MCYVCMNVHVCVHIYMCAHFCVEATGWCQLSSSVSPYLIYWGRVSCWSLSSNTWVVLIASLPQVILLLCTDSGRLLHPSSFYVNAGDPNSGSHAYRKSSLSSESFAQHHLPPFCITSILFSRIMLWFQYKMFMIKSSYVEVLVFCWIKSLSVDWPMMLWPNQWINVWRQGLDRGTR